MEELTNSQLGRIAQLEFEAEAIRRGWKVLLPSNDHKSFDLLLEKDGQFIKIQVKSTQKEKVDYRYKFSLNIIYDKSQVDYMALYLHDIKMFFIIPFFLISVQKYISIYPFNLKSKFNPYKDNWNLKKVHCPQ